MSHGNAADRPDPDVLLARAKKEEAARTRGKLRIYFGASAGVGKTYAMLVAGRRLAADGCDVVIGVVETHGRKETAALLEAELGATTRLEVIPKRAAAPGQTAAFDEFDLDATLVRKPQLVLVDELAHSNAPGARHPKRWQDVDELLTAGIDVFTTLNVQHLESLNDIVGGITGIRVFETVPDTFFDRADEVMLVDIPADELLKRLAGGKVYLPEQAERAARNFFRKGNLIALREIALRRTADRVESDVQAYREDRSIDRVWATEAAVLCCIGPDDDADRVVRSAARLAGQLDAGWHAVYVETPRLQKRSSERRERILRVVRLAEQLGATTMILSGSDVDAALARYAREHNLSRIVMGRNRGRSVARWWSGPGVAEGVAARAPEVDLIVIGRASDVRVEASDAPRLATRAVDGASEADRSAEDRKRRRVRLRYLYAAIACTAVTVVAFPLWRFLHPTNIAMIYLLAVTLIAMRLGRGPAVLASFLAVATFDFFFVPPRFSFAVTDVQYLVTFGVMLTVALVIGTLAANLRYQARVAAHREDRARSLYEIARDLSKALRTEDAVAHARKVIATLFDARVEVLLPANGPGDHEQLIVDPALGRMAGFEPAIAQWAYRQGQPAGTGTDTLSGSPWLFLPLQTPMRARGVLAILPTRRRLLMIPEQRRLLDTLAALLAIAIERTHYVEVAQTAVLRIESERLRNSILSALSHDLRTPVAGLAGLAETLDMSINGGADAHSVETQRQLVAALRDEVRRIGTLVENLLDMARIESGDVKLNRQWHAIEETVGTALAANRRLLAGHRVETSLPRDLPLVQYDAVLMERVLVNLLENAAKYTPPGSTVRIAAHAGPGQLRLTIEDDGPGLPETYRTAAQVESLFDKFTRGVHESARSGVGLGLAICRAIVAAHDGSIIVERVADRGLRFVVTLPRGIAPRVEIEAAEPGTVETDDEHSGVTT
jgi:two-component system sensor histidine kinase KdpD